MISVELAASLKAAGPGLAPGTGDRFTLLTGAFDGEVFTLSDMVVEAHESQAGTVLGLQRHHRMGAGRDGGDRCAVAAAGGPVAWPARAASFRRSGTQSTKGTG